MTSTKYDKAIERTTPIMQDLYRAMRNEGFDRATAKQILETALKCGMLNEAFRGSVDSDAQNK